MNLIVTNDETYAFKVFFQKNTCIFLRMGYY